MFQKPSPSPSLQNEDNYFLISETEKISEVNFSNELTSLDSEEILSF